MFVNIARKRNIPQQIMISCLHLITIINLALLQKLFLQSVPCQFKSY